MRRLLRLLRGGWVGCVMERLLVGCLSCVGGRMGMVVVGGLWERVYGVKAYGTMCGPVRGVVSVLRGLKIY